MNKISSEAVKKVAGKRQCMINADGTISVPLTLGQVAIIDADDFEKIKNYNWHAVKTGHVFYAKRATRKKGEQRIVPMHAVIAGTPAGLCTDHIDGNGLNNRRSNLRICTHAQNQQNRITKSGENPYKGVQKNKHLWQARIWLDGGNRHLGLFTTPEEAALAYNAAAIKHFGEYASLNALAPFKTGGGDVDR
jgi:HNH endonuclease